MILKSIQFETVLCSRLFTITGSTKKEKTSQRMIRLHKNWINQDITH